jgi:hypothetical protein
MQRRAFNLFSVFMLFIFSVVRAQDAALGPGTVTLYSEDGENFTLYLNGEQRNATPSSRVVVSNFAEVPVSFRVVFQDATLPELKRNGMRQGTNCLFSIEKNKKGERVLRIKSCDDAAATAANVPSIPSAPVTPATPAEPVATSQPDQLSAKYANGVITLNDGRTLTVKKVKVNGMTYPRVHMTALTGAKVSIRYDSNDEKFSAEVPFQYEVKDFSNNNAYFTLTVDEGGPKKTWSVKLQNSNGYNLQIE